MKVKLIRSIELLDKHSHLNEMSILENEINQFFQENRNIQVKSMKQSTNNIGTEGILHVVTTVSIWYEEAP